MMETAERVRILSRMLGRYVGLRDTEWDLPAPIVADIVALVTEFEEKRPGRTVEQALAAVREAGHHSALVDELADLTRTNEFTLQLPPQ